MSRLDELVDINNRMKAKVRDKFGDKISDLFVDIERYAIDYLKLIFGRKSMSYEYIAFLIKSNNFHCSEMEITEMALVVSPFIEQMKQL